MLGADMGVAAVEPRSAAAGDVHVSGRGDGPAVVLYHEEHRGHEAHRIAYRLFDFALGGSAVAYGGVDERAVLTVLRAAAVFLAQLPFQLQTFAVARGRQA